MALLIVGLCPRLQSRMNYTNGAGPSLWKDFFVKPYKGNAIYIPDVTSKHAMVASVFNDCVYVAQW